MFWILSLSLVAWSEPRERSPHWLDLLDQAESLRREHRATEAESAYALALQAARQEGRDAPATAIVLHNTGYFRHEAGRVVEAVRLYESAYRWVAAHQPQYVAPLVRIVTNLGVAYAELGQWTKAESLIRPWLGVTPPHEGDFARLRGLLASILAHERKYAEAEPLLASVREALARDPRSGLQQESLAQTISNQASLYAATGRMAEAMVGYEAALAILDELPGRSPVALVRTLHEAALVQIAAGHRENALQLYRRGLGLAEAGNVTDHPALATVFSGYANLLRKLHRGAEAKGFERRAREISQRYEKENLLGHTVDVKSFR